MQTCKHYSAVPKDLKENLRYRLKVHRLCAENERFQAEMLRRSREDILFWINTFCKIFEPRNDPENAVLPWITYGFQDDVILKILNHMGKGDVGILKSRCMGMTWMVIVIATWLWLFHRNQSMKFVSRTEDLVDKSDDSDSLFWKHDFIINNLPLWMQPEREKTHRKNLHSRNPDSDSQIDGEASTGNVGRGGRRRLFFLDEVTCGLLPDRRASIRFPDEDVPVHPSKFNIFLCCPSESR